MNPGHLAPRVLFSLVQTAQDPSNSDTNFELQGKVPNLSIAKFVMYSYFSPDSFLFPKGNEKLLKFRNETTGSYS